jgi:enoyl-CoA hydratase
MDSGGSCYKTLSLSIEAGVARLQFTRPELHNRFDEPQHTEFADALNELNRRRDIRLLMLSATGKSFSAGGDMDMMLRANRSKELRDRLRDEAAVIFNVLTAVPFVVLTAVQGAAIGLGATIVALSDIVVAWRDAKFADPHVQLGLVAGDGGVIGWSQSIGVMRAKRYLLTGERITAARAFEFGMVTDLVDEPQQVTPTAEKIAATILALPWGGVEGTKRSFARLTQQMAGPVFELSLGYEMETFGGQEVREAVTAALKKK